LCCFVEGFSGGSTTHVGIMPTRGVPSTTTRAVPSKSSLEQFFFSLFHGDRNTLPVRKKNGCVLVFCDVGQPDLWLPALSVMVDVRWPAWCSDHQKKKKKIRLIDVWVVETLIYVQRLSLLLLFLKWSAYSAFSGDALAKFFFFFS
jgi:hypothetical protein